jgi:hypothetical protein
MSPWFRVSQNQGDKDEPLHRTTSVMCFHGRRRRRGASRCSICRSRINGTDAHVDDWPVESHGIEPGLADETCVGRVQTIDASDDFVSQFRLEMRRIWNNLERLRIPFRPDPLPLKQLGDSLLKRVAIDHDVGLAITLADLNGAELASSRCTCHLAIPHGLLRSPGALAVRLSWTSALRA